MTGHPFAPLSMALALLSACATVPTPAQRATDAGSAGRNQVWNTELDFAKSMADRNFAAFSGHLSKEAVFFDDRGIEHGAAEVQAAWKPLFESPEPPFAWIPDHVEVLPSGKLALSTGPVLVGGKVVGRFNSIWRLEAPNTWRIVFDKGERVCTPAP